MPGFESAESTDDVTRGEELLVDALRYKPKGTFPFPIFGEMIAYSFESEMWPLNFENDPEGARDTVSDMYEHYGRTGRSLDLYPTDPLRPSTAPIDDMLNRLPKDKIE